MDVVGDVVTIPGLGVIDAQHPEVAQGSQVPLDKGDAPRHIAHRPDLRLNRLQILWRGPGQSDQGLIGKGATDEKKRGDQRPSAYSHHLS